MCRYSAYFPRDSAEMPPPTEFKQLLEYCSEKRLEFPVGSEPMRTILHGVARRPTQTKAPPTWDNANAEWNDPTKVPHPSRTMFGNCWAFKKSILELFLITPRTPTSNEGAAHGRKPKKITENRKHSHATKKWEHTRKNRKHLRLRRTLFERTEY